MADRDDVAAGAAAGADNTLSRRRLMARGAKLAFATPAILAMLQAPTAAAAKAKRSDEESAPSQPSEPSTPSEPSQPSEAGASESTPSDAEAESAPSDGASAASGPSTGSPAAEEGQARGGKKTKLKTKFAKDDDSGNSGKVMLVLYESGDIFYKLHLKGGSAPTAAYIDGPAGSANLALNGQVSRGWAEVTAGDAAALVASLAADPSAYVVAVQYEDGSTMQEALAEL